MCKDVLHISTFQDLFEVFIKPAMDVQISGDNVKELIQLQIYVFIIIIIIIIYRVKNWKVRTLIVH